MVYRLFVNIDNVDDEVFVLGGWWDDDFYFCCVVLFC